MIMPTKIIKPVDSLMTIGSYIVKVLLIDEKNLDDLFFELNKIYYKPISFEKFLLALNFLFIINKVVVENEIIKIRK